MTRVLARVSGSAAWTSEGAGRKERLGFSMSSPSPSSTPTWSRRVLFNRPYNKRTTTVLSPAAQRSWCTARLQWCCKGGIHLHLSSLTHLPAHVTLIAPPCHACSQTDQGAPFQSGTLRASHQSRLESSRAAAARQCLFHGACAVANQSAPTPTTATSILTPHLPALPTANLSLPTAAAAAIWSDVLL